VHKPALGPGGYAAKVERWNKEREDIIAQGLPVPCEGCDERSYHWIRAREVEVAGGQRDVAKPQTKEVVSRIKSLAEQQKAGTFVPDREKDCLTLAIGTEEHGGRCKAISSKMN
jgi:hypothetical protein